MIEQGKQLSSLQNLLSPAWGHLNTSPIVRGEGVYVFDSGGKRFLDFTSGIGVTATGHCHPAVVDAIAQQAAQLVFGQINCMIPEQTLRFAEALQTVTPEGLDCFFFSNSGAEAVEGAVKLAKIATGRTNVIAFTGGFHGRTAMTMALTSSKAGYRAGYQPLPAGVFFAPFPYAFRFGWDEDPTVEFCLAELDQMFRSQTLPSETAAVLIEPVLGEGGFVPAPLRFLSELRRVCDEHEILLIVDEIQSGFGRAGDFWAHTSSGIKPDILLMAKAIASGMPLSAIAASRQLMENWSPGSHGGTYGGGSAVAMQAAQATLQVIQSERLVENSHRMGAHLTSRLSKLQKQFPVLADVRGRGLMIACELVDQGQPATELVKAIQQKCLADGLMLLSCGSHSNVIRWLPPLIVTAEQIDEALDIFDTALRAALD
jgi:4-aminobutyrate aminotransferase